MNYFNEILNYPIIEFGSKIYNSEVVQTDKLIERIQRRITRMIIKRCFPKKYTTIPAYHIRCAILNLKH